MKKRMRADSAEELMEIVRALQNGEEPDIRKIKEAQRQEQLRSERERQQKRMRQQKAGRPEKDAEETAAEDVSEDTEDAVDEFEQILNMDSAGGSGFGRSAVEAAVSGVRSFAARRHFKKKKRYEETELRGEDSDEILPEETDDAAEAQDGTPEELPKKDIAAKREPELPKEDIAAKREPEPPKKDTAAKREPEPPKKDTAAKQEPELLDEDSEEMHNLAQEAIYKLPSTADDDETYFVRRIGSLAASEHEAGVSAPKSAGFRFWKRKRDPGDGDLWEESESPETDAGAPEPKEKPLKSEAEFREPDAEKTERKAKFLRRDKNSQEPDTESTSADGTKRARFAPGAEFGKLMGALAQKGIRTKELAMLVIAAVIVVLIAAVSVRAVQNALENGRKSQNVTADQGLSVTVEDEPETWCSQYPVVLKILLNRQVPDSVNINGQTYTPGEDGLFVVETSEWILEAEVDADDGPKKAQIEIPKLDGDAPVLEIRKEEQQIILSAVDARSSVEGIYYAVNRKQEYMQMPEYIKYSKAVPFEEDCVYRFYAKDTAGNRTVPVVTTLAQPESFSLNRTEVSLFPGETFSLGVTTEPEGALLESLKFESMDERVLHVESNGKVTAVGAGTAAVRVSAGGLENQICTFEVNTERTVTISAIGDCTLGTDESFNTNTSLNAFASVNGYSYFFQNVKDILDGDDATFANLEGTFTEQTTREAKQFAFKGDPAYTEILTEGSVEVVTLANNHSSDYGPQSREDTKRALAEAGVDYCDGDEIVMRDVNGVRTAFIGIYVLNDGMAREAQVKETIARAKQQGAQLVITAFHWGSENQNYPDATQVSLAHTAVDAGADLVVGHHPHVLQGIELYNGAYIAYSLGNFCFGGNSGPSDMDTMILRQTFTVSESGVQAGGELEIIPCSISSAVGYNNYQPTPLAGEAADRVIARINEYSAQFGQTYAAADISGTE